jgi:hypothetical protein
MRPRLAALVALSAAALGCGETLVDHSGARFFTEAPVTTCGDNLILCNGACVAQTAARCGACDHACPAAPANATEACFPTGPGGHAGTCDFTCDPGLLRCASGCCAPALVAAGGAFSCATTTTGEVHCFGAGDVGQLGNGGVLDRATSAVVGGFAAPVSTLAAGGAHACAISGGQTLCWGNGAAFGASGAVLDPQVVPALAGATAISAGVSHTCGIVGAQAVCVGGTAATGAGTPALGGAALAVAAGDRFSCALVDQGAGNAAVKCWGIDTFGQLGDGVSGSASATPLQVGSGVVAANVSHLAAGARHACAGTANPATTNQTLWCWGDNAANQLGAVAGALLGPTLNGRVKKPILRLAAGDHATCAMEDDAGGGGRALSCWTSDALLLGTSNTGEPIHVTASVADYAFSAGGAHVCFVDALQSPARLKCFGAGARGQLGNGGTASSPLSPVLVVDR